MRFDLLILSLFPVIIFLIWINIKDKYNKEPLKNILKYFVLGIFCSFVAVYFEDLFLSYEFFIGNSYNIYLSFVVAGLVEEGLKFIFLFVFLQKEKYFDEKLDGIIYSVILSLGFSAVENIIYLFFEEISLVYQIGIMRALISIPAHIMFGITMGYYLSKYKFETSKIYKKQSLFLAFIFPVVLHGVFDFILMINARWSIILFMMYVAFLWKFNLDKLDEYIKISKIKFKIISKKGR